MGTATCQKAMVSLLVGSGSAAQAVARVRRHGQSTLHDNTRGGACAKGRQRIQQRQCAATHDSQNASAPCRARTGETNKKNTSSLPTQATGTGMATRSSLRDATGAHTTLNTVKAATYQGAEQAHNAARRERAWVRLYQRRLTRAVGEVGLRDQEVHRVHRHERHTGAAHTHRHIKDSGVMWGRRQRVGSHTSWPARQPMCLQAPPIAVQNGGGRLTTRAQWSPRHVAASCT